MNLYLIGYRGSGKSSVAPLVASRLQWQWLDTDQRVESIAGQTIAKIFETDGEQAFRSLESAEVERLGGNSKVVVALGGGVPLSATNRQIMAATGRIVWLRCGAEILFSRLQEDKTTTTQRPRLTALDPREEVRQLLEERNTVYAACADYTVDTDELSPDEVADRIARWWKSVDT